MFVRRSVVNRITVILGLVLAVLFFGKIFYDIKTDRKRAVSNAEQRAKGLASALNEHALRTFNGTEETIDSVIRSISAVSPAGLPDEKTLQKILAGYRRPESVIATLFVASPGGTLHAISTEYPVRPIKVADREYFQHHLTSPDRDLFISRPFRNRLDNEWLNTATKRLSNPNGTLRMIVGVSVRTQYFSSFYSTLELGRSDRILLVRRDGKILSLEPFSEKILQADFIHTQLFDKELKLAPVAGTYQVDKTPLDGTDRIVSYRSCVSYPVLALVSLNKKEQLRDWRARSARELAGAGLFVVLVASFGFLIRRQLAHLEEANRQLSCRQVELSEAKRRSQDIVNSIDGIVWEIDLASQRFTFVSKRSEAITGFTSREWLCDPLFWSQRVHPGDSSWSGCYTQQSGNLDGASFEYRFRKKDGSTIWIRDLVTVVAEQGHPVRLRGVMLDISQAKLAEEALRASEERYRRISNAITDYIYTVRIGENLEVRTWHGAG
jgi:PAS domain S-box-containing protein